MKIFYTSSAKQLEASNQNLYELKKFCDGEIFLKLNCNVENENVWIVSSTQAPSENIIELSFLLDALQRNKAKLNLVFTYFGYARHDRIIEKGEALSAQIISNFFKQFDIKKCLILHPHSSLLHDFIKFDSIFPNDLYYPLIKNTDVIIAPDKGAIANCESIAKNCSKEFGWLEKFRPEHEKTKVLKLNGNVKNKNVIIIDDMITTGNTVINASNYLFYEGAKSVEVIATHGVFCKDSIERIEQSKIKKVYVTNSIEQRNKSDKVQIIDISKYILDYLK